MKKAELVYELDGSVSVTARLGKSNKPVTVDTRNIFALLAFLKANQLQVAKITTRLTREKSPVIK